MGIDEDLAGILREVVQFLESLCDIDLPLKIENAKENLLQRSRTKLSSRGSTSPEPYLDMNAGKGLLLFPNRNEIEIEEYVGVEEQPVGSPPSHQDYYESFQEIGSTITDRNNKATASTTTTTTCSKKIGCEVEADDKLLEMYKTLTPATTMNKAHKFGPLDHKVERKSFGFVRGNIRPCWVGLVGSHLLIYSSEKDKQPPEISSIRGYMGRPASNAIFKDQEQAKSAFEIFCPGNKTLQFIAKSPREMEEWIAAIGRTSLSVQDRDSGMCERSVDEKIETELPDDTVAVKERYQDVGGLLPSPKREEPVVLRTTSPVPETGNGNKVTRSDSDKKKDSVAVSSVSPPALPVRVPRRLPSLPNEEALTTSYEPLDDGYEEDDIYHKIEDFRDNGRSYENVKKKTGKRGKVKKIEKKKEEKKKKKIDERSELETYDDVENKLVESKKDEAKKKRRISLLRESPSRKVDAMETYDDVQTIVQDTQTPLICNSRSPRRDLCESFGPPSETNFRSSSMTYDDVTQPSSIVSIDSQTKTETRESRESNEAASPAKSPTKSPHKRSFLDRVRHRKDSPKKEDKKRVEGTIVGGKQKEKRKVSLEPTPQTSGKAIESDLPTYDDVSEYLNDLNSQNTSQEETKVSTQVDDISNYNCPPPPRPIYVKPLNPDIATSVKNDRELIEDVYDDIANYHDNNIEIDHSTEVKKTMLNLITTEKPKIKRNGGNGVVENSVKSASRVSAIIDEENHEKENKLSVDTEHYQTPRRDSFQVNPCTVAASEQEEQLYDDIAILAEFRARQRDSGTSSSYDIRSYSSIATVDRLTISLKKPWNRFGSGKKVTTRDVSTAQTTTMKNRSCTDPDEINDPSVEKTDPAKPNKLKKLINKMESTLGKQPSAKSVNTLSNKTHNGE